MVKIKEFIKITYKTSGKKLQKTLESKIQSKRVFKKEPRQTLHFGRVNFLGGEMEE